MTFVFEASRLPFDSITNAVGDAALALVDDSCASIVAALPLWDKCLLTAVLPMVQSASQRSSSKDAIPEGQDKTATAAEVTLSLRIVKELNELEAAYDHAKSVIQGRREEGGNPAHSSGNTAEEIMMDALLRERFGPDCGMPGMDAFCVAGADDSDGEDDDTVDIAMCFDTAGASVGIGSAAVFGGHGYHAH